MKEKFKKGDTVKIIADTSSSSNKIGDIGIITDIDIGEGNKPSAKVQVTGGSKLGNWSYFTDLELVESESKKLSKEDELLEYAKKHYPIGTQYIPAHVSTGLNEVINTNYRFDSPHILVDSKHIERQMVECIYENGKWAEIITKPIIKEEEIPKILKGRYIEALVDYPVGGMVKKGEIGVYINEVMADFPSSKRYSCSNLYDYIKEGKLKLLPEDYKPKIETVDKQFYDSRGRILKVFIPGKWYKRTDNNDVQKLQHNTITKSYDDTYHYNSLVFDQKLKNGIIINEISTISNSDIDILLEEINIDLFLKQEEQISKYWFIENKYPEVREYLAEKYDVKKVLTWTHPYIGFDNCGSNHGVHGSTRGGFINNAKEIDFEYFKKHIYTKKEQPKAVQSTSESIKEDTKLLGEDFDIDEEVYWNSEKVIIRGFHKNNQLVVVERDSFRSGHSSYDDAWNDKYGKSISHKRNRGSNRYWNVYLLELKKINKKTHEDKNVTQDFEWEVYSPILKFRESTSDKALQLLQPKEDKRLNTSVNKIESVKIQLKQKSKSIKF